MESSYVPYNMSLPEGTAFRAQDLEHASRKRLTCEAASSMFGHSDHLRYYHPTLLRQHWKFGDCKLQDNRTIARRPREPGGLSARCPAHRLRACCCSTGILGSRRTAPFALFRITHRVPHGFTQDPSTDSMGGRTGLSDAFLPVVAVHGALVWIQDVDVVVSQPIREVRAAATGPGRDFHNERKPSAEIQSRVLVPRSIQCTAQNE